MTRRWKWMVDGGGITPDGPRLGSLFTGAAGLDMAVTDVLDTTTAWHAEVDPAASRLLAYRFPTIPNLGDVTKVDWSAVEPVDVICGGSPCQDVSHAGKRAGMRAGTRSGLWESMREAVAVIRPRLVVWENVRGVLSAEADSEMEPCPGCVGDGDDGPVLRALGRVLGDLADLGYDTSWHGLRAADVGAPHGRFRVFVTAWPAAFTQNLGHERGGVARGWRHGPADGGDAVADTGGSGWERRGTPRVTGTCDAATGSRGAATDWGQYAPAIRRWERAIGRVAPAPTETGPKGGQRLSPRFVEWMMGWPAGWVTDVPGLSRNDQLKICGNGVVPQQAAEALRRILAAQSVAA